MGFKADLAAYNGTVLDVSESTLDFLMQHWRYVLWLCFITVLLEAGILLLRGDIQFMILPLLISAYAYYRVHKRMQELFFPQLAAELGMAYQSSSTITSVAGHFFEVGNSQGDPKHVFTGTYQGAPI